MEQHETTWTLGDVRAVLREGLPPDGLELISDVSDGDEDSQHLPYCIVVSREALQRVRSGELDHLPDTIPLEEAFVTRFDCPVCGRPHLA